MDGDCGCCHIFFIDSCPGVLKAFKMELLGAIAAPFLLARPASFLILRFLIMSTSGFAPISRNIFSWHAEPEVEVLWEIGTFAT